MKIKYENQILEANPGITVKELLKEEIKNAKIEVIACLCNNEVRSLNLKLTEDANISLIDLNSKDGMMIYIRGIMYIMAKALNELYPKALLTVNYQLSNAMFCELDNMQVTDEMIERIHKRMEEIIAADLEIRKVKMTAEEAAKFYEKEHTLKGKVQIDQETSFGASLYYCEEYYNYFFGVMPISTGYTKIYDIVKPEFEQNRLKIEKIEKEILILQKRLLDIKEYILQKLYDDNKKSFIRNKDGKIDISLLGLVTPFKIFAPKEKKILNTVEKIDLTLRTYTGGYLRYEGDNYAGGNPWVISNLWMANYYIEAGNKSKARECFEYVVKTATEHGFLAEQIDNKTMRSKMGNRSWMVTCNVYRCIK